MLVQHNVLINISASQFEIYLYRHPNNLLHLKILFILYIVNNKTIH